MTHAYETHGNLLILCVREKKKWLCMDLSSSLCIWLGAFLPRETVCASLTEPPGWWREQSWSGRTAEQSAGSGSTTRARLRCPRSLGCPSLSSVGDRVSCVRQTGNNVGRFYLRVSWRASGGLYDVNRSLLYTSFTVSNKVCARLINLKLINV